MRQINKIVLASMSADKFREMAALFRDYPEIELIPAEGLIRNPEKLGFAEVHSTYLDNAIAKARLANQASHYPALADDSGLEIGVLGGKPGVRSRRYATVSTDQIRSKIAQDQANVAQVLSEMKGKTERTARFVTALALLVEGILIHAEGHLDGDIAEAPRGENGFGYDPIFIPKGSQKTLAEMTEAEKNAISHRAKAVQELMLRLKAREIVLAKP